MEIEKVEELLARYNAGDESVWVAKNTACYDSEGEFLGNDGMTVNAEDIPHDVVWTESEWLCVGYEACKYVSQEYADPTQENVTTYTVVERTER